MGSLWELLLIWTILSVTVNALILRSSRSQRQQERTPVYFGGLLPNTELIPAIQHAMRDINNHVDVLPKHELRFTLVEAPVCDKNRGIQKYLDLVDILPRKLILLNGLCSDVIRAIDHISVTPNGNSNFPKILQVSYANSDSSFDGSTIHPSVFRLLPSETTFNEPRTKLLLEILAKAKHNTGVGLLYQNIEKYLLPHEDQLAKLLQHRVTGLESESFENNATIGDLRGVLSRLKEKNVSIMLGNFDSSWARKVFCLAYKEKMYGDNFPWLISGDYEPKWWRVDDTDCFPHELERALQGMVRIDILPFVSNFMDKTTPELRSLHHNAVNASKLYRYVYDAVWTIAIALKNSNYYYSLITRQKTDASVDYLTNSTINYQNPNWDMALHKSLSLLSLVGVTGQVRFNSKQGRVGYSLLIKQFHALASGYDEVNIGDYESMNKTLNMGKYPHPWIRKRILYSGNSEFGLQNPKHNEHVTGNDYDPYSASGAVHPLTAPLLTAIMAYAFLINLIMCFTL